MGLEEREPAAPGRGVTESDSLREASKARPRQQGTKCCQLVASQVSNPPPNLGPKL